MLGALVHELGGLEGIEVAAIVGKARLVLEAGFGLRDLSLLLLQGGRVPHDPLELLRAIAHHPTLGHERVLVQRDLGHIGGLPSQE